MELQLYIPSQFFMKLPHQNFISIKWLSKSCSRKQVAQLNLKLLNKPAILSVVGWLMNIWQMIIISSQVGFMTILHLSTRRYAWTVHRWVEQIGLDPIYYGTHTMLRTKVAFRIPADKKLKGGTISFGPY